MNPKMISLLAVLLVLGVVISGCNNSTIPKNESVKVNQPQSEVVFEWGNTLQTMGIDGTKLRGLTSENSVNSSSKPFWSPDGKRISFISRGKTETESKFCVMNRDGTNRIEFELPKSDSGRTYPIWSPKGNKLSFVCGQDLYCIDADGTHLVNLTQDKNVKVFTYYSPAWAPDGSKILFTDGTLTKNAICVVSPDGSNFKKLVQAPDVKETDARFEYPVWSPDGNKISFFSLVITPKDEKNQIDYFLVLTNSNGENRINIPLPGMSEMQVWSADSTKLAFWSLDGNISNLYCVSSDGKGLVNLTDYSFDIWEQIKPDQVQYMATMAFNTYVTITSPQWMPDGTKIFYNVPSNKDDWDIYSVSIDRKTRTNLTNGGSNSEFLLSEDGSKVVYYSWTSKENSNYYVMKCDGSERICLTSNMEQKQSGGFSSLFPYGPMKIPRFRYW